MHSRSAPSGRVRFAALLALLMLVSTSCGPGTQGDTGLPAGARKLQHLIFIIQENRSFDHYFGTFPGADGIPMNNGVPTVCLPDPTLGRCVPPFHDSSLINLVVPTTSRTRPPT